ncbi:HTH luxR-type domain-containing protein [Hyphomicrobiales bacterium]|nr:HTH luxR-type domain-containing protein [Hyphomicrobiales bacterium]CAH1698953.1 HTH luxR-type domain-containing protein [Hyphomicrobiales bacterium]CAI0342598.1 HTH luxR-type domain-containing protein [Hyphomicrobiales bacterium]
MNADNLASRIAAFSQDAAKAIDRFDRSDAPYLLLDAINRVVPFKFAMSVVYRRHATPVYVADTFPDRTGKRALELYIEGTYLLNPVYNAYLAGLKAGVHRLRDLAPDAYFTSDHYRQFKVQQQTDEELGYRTYGWPAGMEELVVAVELPKNELAEISFYRRVSLGGFSDADCELLSVIEPLIGAIFRRIWQHCGKDSKPEARWTSFDALLGDFGKGQLSPRECDVAHMILKGHSSESISRNLGISVTTVKTHRQNLYAKLGLSTQQELFSLFLMSLQKQTGAEPTGARREASAG